MFADIRKRVQKIGQPPGTSTYTGKAHATSTKVIKVTYSEHDFHEVTCKTPEEVRRDPSEKGVTWLHVEGLGNVSFIEQLAQDFGIHPLTVEDILNIEQRPKIEQFENYIFITLKMLTWDKENNLCSTEQISFVLGHNFLLSFQDNENIHFNAIRERLRGHGNQRLRQQNSDYLTYRLMDAIVDYYFVVLEGLGDEIEKVEERITLDPKPHNTHTIYQIKHQLMSIRKEIWPMREMISHLLQMDEEFISRFTRVYLRDLYDHVVQAMDTVETFRDILASMLDMYLSSLANRMNEVMKTLTIIATIFIPITFIASIYGMNFDYMPELHWHWGYFSVLGLMLLVSIIMLIYFRRKKWL